MFKSGCLLTFFYPSDTPTSILCVNPNSDNIGKDIGHPPGRPPGSPCDQNDADENDYYEENEEIENDYYEENKMIIMKSMFLQQ